jgi:hypothetical protein
MANSTRYMLLLAMAAFSRFLVLAAKPPRLTPQDPPLLQGVRR